MTRREEIARILHEAHKPFCDYTYPFEDPQSSSHVYYALADALAGALSPQDWLPIETAPRGRGEDGRFRYCIFIGRYPGAHGGWSDQYVGWVTPDGDYMRWPHAWPPTHWLPAPPTPPFLLEGKEKGAPSGTGSREPGSSIPALTGFDPSREIALNIRHWLDFDRKQRAREGLETTDDTHLIAPPHWPTHGQLKNWIEVLEGRPLATEEIISAKARAMCAEVCGTELPCDLCDAERHEEWREDARQALAGEARRVETQSGSIHEHAARRATPPSLPSQPPTPEASRTTDPAPLPDTQED